MKWIKEFVDGDHILGQLLVSNVVKGVTDKGMTYLNVTLQDRTGTVEAKKWNADDKDLEIIVPGKVINVEGTVNLYKNQNQLKITGVSEVLPSEEIDMINFQKACPIDPEVLESKLKNLILSIKDKDVAEITKKVISKFYDKYITYPGAKSIHHEFGGGLMMHSVCMAELADQIAKMYPNIDRDILVAGALLHDIGKTVEYSGVIAPQITLEGRLCGHISIMYAEFKKIVDEMNIQSEVPLLLEHMILSHHGTLEFGSPVVPQTKEALLLSMIDLLDSRMMVIDKALEKVKPGEFTEKIWAMDNVAFYKPKER